MLIFSKYRVFNDTSLLLICMAKIIRQSNATFTVVVVVRCLSIVMLFANCDITNCPVITRRYVTTDGAICGTRHGKPQLLMRSCTCWSWWNGSRALIRYALLWLVLFTGTAQVVSDNRYNNDSADRIAVNSYKHTLNVLPMDYFGWGESVVGISRFKIQDSRSLYCNCHT